MSLTALLGYLELSVLIDVVISRTPQHHSEEDIRRFLGEVERRLAVELGE